MLFLNRSQSGKEEGLSSQSSERLSTSAGTIPGQEPRTPQGLWPKQSQT